MCAHRWVHAGEPGFGAVIANDGVYGHDATLTTENGTVITTVRQSLLRAPTFPDPGADQGVHEVTSLIAPAQTTDQASFWGRALAAPPRIIRAENDVAPLVTIDDGSSAVLSAVKLADDRSGDVIVRLVEQRGARTSARLRFGFRVREVIDCDLVETPGEKLAWEDPVSLSAFQVRTVRVVREDDDER